MFGGMGKNFWGLQVSFLWTRKWQVKTTKELHQNHLFHTTNRINEHFGFHHLRIEIVLCTTDSFGIEYIPQYIFTKSKTN